MARTRTLTLLRDDVRAIADAQGATARHTDASLTREINQAIQRFREWVSEEGFPLYLTPYAATLTAGATSPYAWKELDLSAISPAMLHVYGVDVTINGRICQLDAIPWEQRNDYQGASGPTNGYPVAFMRYGFKLGILPAPSSTMTATVWYLPVGTDLSADSDTFDGFAGWEEWVRWDVLVMLYTRDQLPVLLEHAKGERDRLRMELQTKLRKDRPSVTRRRDVAGRRGTRFPWGTY